MEIHFCGDEDGINPSEWLNIIKEQWIKVLVGFFMKGQAHK
jgi:hypothetical protein